MRSHCDQYHVTHKGRAAFNLEGKMKYFSIKVPSLFNEVRAGFIISN